MPRSYCVSHIRSTDTDLECAVRTLHKRGLRFRKHVSSMFTAARVIVFVDGDFWHGYRFPRWRACRRSGKRSSRETVLEIGGTFQGFDAAAGT